ncbi:hypothetical protein EWM64_g4638 [Hericium alpestre]|uniref:ER membrane protein complex subunit 7 beta-sandwich domain-containing protein n=1 Tax=Hericium alpestre TaxID=135208 RepID=A0A4Y9ZXR4_9AGAM|nr:hypothetical protein EWM64_g4638 [Hericium alpestre]
MARLISFLALLGTCVTVFGADVAGFIRWNEHCTDIADLGQAKVVLDNGEAWGSVNRNGNFVIPDVTPGTYLLSVISHDHHFDKLRIDVPSNAELPKVRPYIAGTPMNPPSPIKLPYPIRISARQRNTYFVPREGFNVLGMFQNPMMMMMAAAGVMMLATPYLMKSMDPEMVQEFQQNQAKMANLQSSLQTGDIKSGSA